MALKRRRHRFEKAYGVLESCERAVVDLPAHVSSRAYARIANVRESGGCSFCFPHGPETVNASIAKNRRSWKHTRRQQFRSRGVAS